MSEATIPIKELMEKTEQWLLGQGYKKSTLGFYRATWNRFLSYSASPAYSRETAEQFLLQYFGVDVHAIDQTLDGRMRHARRHMNALDEIFRTGTVCRRKVYGVASIDDDCFDKFFSDYLSYCKMQNFSRSWMDNTIAALRLFLLAVHSSNTQNIKSINAETINCFSTAMSNASEICMNVRRARCRQVGAYLHWLYDHKYTDLDYSLQLPNFKRTAPQIPQVWSPEEIDKILAVIDTANPVGRRNYAIFLLLARTGLRISDVLGLKFSNINWKENCISLSQQKTGNALSLPLSKELGMAIISYLQDGRPQSSSAFIFLSHNAPFQPLSRYGVTYILKKYAAKASPVLEPQNISPHVLRHTKAMHLLRAGVNMIYIRDFLGHADISTTEVYARIDAEMKRKVFEEKVPNYTPNTTMPWEEDEDLLQWLTQFGKKTF